MNRSEKAVNKFKDGFNCAQSVLFCYAEDLKIPEGHALRIANGFGSGMGRKQEICGAVSGGILVLNHLYGSEKAKDNDELYAKVRAFMDGFEKEFGSVNCKKLLGGCELMTPEGQEQFAAANLIEDCYGYVAHAVTLLDELIEK